jgi:apolipoprotein N-acyltransferase
MVLQPNIQVTEEWSSVSAANFREQLVNVSMQAALRAGEPRPDLILWPEMPAPLYFESDPRFRNQVLTIARVTGTPILFGNVAFTKEGRPLNSATMVAPPGEMIDRYDKINLVPFGEFIPPLFGFVDKISSEAGDFAPGNRIVVFKAGEHRVGAFICYESVFPHLVRQFAASGAELLVNLSNDGYFAKSAAREQHLKIVRMRAAENRRWLIRATNDGLTATFDPAGRIVDRIPPYQELVSRTQFSYRSDVTPYTRFGDWFAWSCLGVSALLLARELAWYRFKR